LFHQKAFIITVLVKVVAAGLRLGPVLLLPVLSVVCFPSGVEIVSKEKQLRPSIHFFPERFFAYMLFLLICCFFLLVDLPPCPARLRKNGATQLDPPAL
jgi:hypothetical protein